MPNLEHIQRNVRELRLEVNQVLTELKISTPIEILAVTKYSDISNTRLLFECGLTHLGENRIQSASPKIEALPKSIHWSMIGHLQSNKVNEAVRHFNRIQSVDSIRLLEKIQNSAQKLNKTIEVFLQINMTDEVQKFGFNAQSILTEIPDSNRYPNVKITGIMAFGPHTQNEDEIRRSFESTHHLFSRLKNEIPSLSILSMGMSQDFKIAIACGANQIRIGQRLIAE